MILYLMTQTRKGISKHINFDITVINYYKLKQYLTNDLKNFV